MSGSLEISPLATYSTREWASWLAHGVRAFFRLTVMPPSFSPNDAFPFGKRYIGINASDLGADLIDLHRDLPAPAQARFEEAVILVWAELDFDRAEHYAVGSVTLSMARKGRIRGILDILSSSLPHLHRALRRPDLSATAAKLRREMFSAVVDLAVATPRSVSAVRALLDAQRFDPNFHFATGMEAMSGLARLCRSVPSETEGWIALFASSIGAGLDLKDRAVTQFLHRTLAEACGKERLLETIDRMRGLAATDMSPTDGHVTFRHRLEADIFLTAISNLPESQRKEQASPSALLIRTQMSAVEVAECLYVG